MIETLARDADVVGDDLSAAGLLALARSRKAAEDRAAADLLEIAARWADLHPPESIHTAASFTVAGCEHEEPLAGPGTPLVAEFCLAELGAVLGLSTTSAKRLVGHALELRHRLPRLAAGVQAGTVPAWRARTVAEATIHATPALTLDAAAFVDAQVAAVAGRVGPAQLDRLVAEAIKRYDLAAVDPASDPEDGYLYVDPRHVTVLDHDVHYAGTIHIEADIDLADGLDFNHAIARDAAQQKSLGSTESLDVRRAKALGNLARTQTALDLASDVGGRAAREERAGVSRPDFPAAREVVLHAHFNASPTDAGIAFDETGRLEEGRRLVLLDHVRDWCADSRTKVTIRPMIDLNTELSTSAYAPTARIREAVVLRDRTCVFPWCTRPARGCDLDHVVPFDPNPDPGHDTGGPTSTSNLAPLCRSHHRLKTHTAWRYRMLEPGTYEWTSPHGHHFRRDHTGSSPVPADDEPPDRP